MRILIVHGPNMNLFSIRSSKEGKNITLDKINRSIRRHIRNKNIDIKIIQTHKESKIVSYLHANRNNFDGIILTPGPWQNSGYVLQDTLNIIEHDYVVIKITQDESINLLSGSKNIFNDDIYKSFEEALDYYVSK